MLLDLRYKLVFALYLWHFFTDFLQILHESWYLEGVSSDCRWVNFDKYVQSYGPWFTLLYKLVFALYLWHFFTDFLQTLHESWYWEGVSWDCRCVNFNKYVQSYVPWFTLEIGFCSLSLTFLHRFSTNFAWELILGRSVLGLQMEKFRQICTELWPLIYVGKLVFSLYLGLDSISKQIYNVWSHFDLYQSLRRLSCNNSIKFQ